MYAKKQPFENEFKRRVAEQIIDQSLNAAQTARELGLQPAVVQSWVRSARGTNKKRRKSRRTQTINDQIYIWESSFQAYDSQKKQLIVDLYRLKPLESKTEFSEDRHKLLFANKSEIKWIRKGLYKMPTALYVYDE